MEVVDVRIFMLMEIISNGSGSQFGKGLHPVGM